MRSEMLKSLAHASVLACLAFHALGTLPAAAQTKVGERFAVRPDGYVRIHNRAGNVRVSGWDRDSVVVEGAVHESRNGEWAIGGSAEGVRMSLWPADAGAAIRASTLDVRVPRNAQLWIKTETADIQVSGVQGSLDVNSVTGRITVSGGPREIFAETLGGELQIDATSTVVRARTASGDIRVRGAIREVTATTVSGDLRIEGDRFERGTFESVDSDIHYTGAIGRSSILDFKNHAGAIEFVLPADVSAEFVVSSYTGGFDDQFGVKAEIAAGKLKGQEVRYTLGSGGGQVHVLNFKGPVILRRR